MDLTGTGIEIDPTGTTDAQDRADEFDAKLRERRGEFTGFYTQTDESKTKAMREINNHRGLSGNAQNMMEEIHAIRDAKMKLGRGPGPGHLPKEPELYGPYEEGVGPENFIRRDEEDVTSTQHFRDTTMGNMIHYMGHTQGAISDKYPADDPLYTPGKRASENIIHGRADDWYAQVEAWFNAVDGHIADAESTGISQGGAKAISWLARGIIGEPLRALRELQDADLTRTPSDSPTGTETVQKVVNNAVNVGVLSTVAPAPKGALRVFGGTDAAENLAKAGQPQAQTAIEIATMLEKKGVPEAKIREMTRSLADEGGFGNVSKAADGQWVVEVPSHNMKMRPFEDYPAKGWQYMDDLVPEWEMAYKAFPELKDVKVIIQKISPNMKNFRPSGSFAAPDEIRIVARNAEDVQEVLIHEVEHFAQNYRKGAYGANDEFDGDFAYNYSAGELQANSSMIRHEMTAQELSEVHPRMHEQTTDGKIIPRSEQIVRTREEWETGRKAAAQSSNRDLASDTAPRDWVPVGGDKKHLHKDYVLVDTTTGRPVGSATTKDRADKAAGKRGGREDEASTVKAMKTQDWLDQQWNGPDMKRWRETQLARTGKHGSLPEEAQFRKLMGEQYKIAEAGEDYSTMKDILQGRLANDRSMPQPMREAMELKVAALDHAIKSGSVLSRGGFYGDKKMSAQDISTEERKLATSLRSNTVRKEGLERDLKSDRFNKSELERKQKALDKHNARIEELKERLTEVANIKEARSIIPSRVNDVRESAVTPNQQGVPKTLSEDIGRMPKRRSKLERLEEDKETLETLINLETRVPRLDRAKKHLKKVESDLEKIKSGE